MLLGLYRLMPNGEAVLVKKCNDRTLVKRSDEFFYVREIPAGTVLEYFNELGLASPLVVCCCMPFFSKIFFWGTKARVVARGRFLTLEHELTPRALAIIKVGYTLSLTNMHTHAHTRTRTHTLTLTHSH